MEWRDSFLDLALIPLSLLLPMAYHAWLWREVRLRPLRTAVGINAATRRLWAIGMMKDNAKNAVTVVQSVRNVIMGSTLMATTAILFCTGVAAVLSSTYTIKKPLSDTVFGAHGEYMMALKDYIGDVLERGFTLNLVGNRLFYAGPRRRQPHGPQRMRRRQRQICGDERRERVRACRLKLPDLCPQQTICMRSVHVIRLRLLPRATACDVSSTKETACCSSSSFSHSCGVIG
uniref:Uncharacterized protein n=1 Tax=Zea mays TaxID=4577 RepID=A0A804QC88_MAIZE